MVLNASHLLTFVLYRGSSRYGQFGRMLKENQDKIGCCFITYEDYKDGRQWHSHMVTCLYENTLYLNTQIYTKGKPASRCRDYGDEYATSVTYPNLCTRKKAESVASPVRPVFVVSLIVVVFHKYFWLMGMRCLFVVLLRFSSSISIKEVVFSIFQVSCNIFHDFPLSYKKVSTKSRSSVLISKTLAITTPKLISP